MHDLTVTFSVGLVDLHRVSYWHDEIREPHACILARHREMRFLPAGKAVVCAALAAQVDLPAYRTIHFVAGATWALRKGLTSSLGLVERQVCDVDVEHPAARTPADLLARVRREAPLVELMAQKVG
eukprot:CAMPEP_0182799500 /NCGR_PEP_ID=MMETSP0006_2-20121128/1918_1 /TAXON_ID=97485 /ORGANISM="Prymnesium parvum, Strain Texoma1" /LENGTH=125 /DNA_ID=CAMNT_0024924691 /DNA_START=697 /DNA_END=1075 /DNA_ORIENTATION=+